VAGLSLDASPYTDSANTDVLTPTGTHQRRLRTIAEAEAEYFNRLGNRVPAPPLRRRSRAEKNRDAERLKKLRSPFGYGNGAWESLKAQMQPGDELWEFCTPKATWDQGMGSAGYQLVRGDVIICTMVVRMN
jgi:hypothetical protein